MHRFFILLIIWILVEAYWIAPNTKRNIEINDFDLTRSGKVPCGEGLELDSLNQKIEMEIME